LAISIAEEATWEVWLPNKPEDARLGPFVNTGPTHWTLAQSVVLKEGKRE